MELDIQYKSNAKLTSKKNRANMGMTSVPSVQKHVDLIHQTILLTSFSFFWIFGLFIKKLLDLLMKCDQADKRNYSTVWLDIYVVQIKSLQLPPFKSY